VRAGGRLSQNKAVMSRAEVKHQAQVAPMTNGSRKVRYPIHGSLDPVAVTVVEKRRRGCPATLTILFSVAAIVIPFGSKSNPAW